MRTERPGGHRSLADAPLRSGEGRQVWSSSVRRPSWGIWGIGRPCALTCPVALLPATSLYVPPPLCPRLGPPRPPLCLHSSVLSFCLPTLTSPVAHTSATPTVAGSSAVRSCPLSNPMGKMPFCPHLTEETEAPRGAVTSSRMHSGQTAAVGPGGPSAQLPAPVCPPVCPPARRPPVAVRPVPALTGPHPPSGPSILELMHLAHWGPRRETRPETAHLAGRGGAGGTGGLPQARQGCTGWGNYRVTARII